MWLCAGIGLSLGHFWVSMRLSVGVDASQESRKRVSVGFRGSVRKRVDDDGDDTKERSWK